MIRDELKFLLIHSSIYGVGNIIPQFVSFLLLPLYTRYLTPADYGVLETINISTGIIGVVLTMGIARALGRFYYESDDQRERNKVVSTCYATYAVGAFVFLVPLMFLSGLASHLLFRTGQYGVYFKVSLVAFFLGGIIDIGMMYLRLINRPVAFISVTITRLVLLVAFNILFIVHFKLGILGILMSTLITRFVFSIGMTAGILAKTGVSFVRRLSGELLRYGLPMIPSTLGNTVVKQSDKFFILYLLSVGHLGIYSLALRFGNMLPTFLVSPLNMAYVPRRFEIMNRDGAARTFSMVCTYHLFLMTFLGLVISVFLPDILRLMVTAEFYPAARIIPLYILSMVILGLHFHFDFGVLYAKRTDLLAVINIVSAAMHLVLNYLLIAALGVIGAVWSSIIVYSVQAFLLFRASDSFYSIKYEFRRIGLMILLACCFYLLSDKLALHNLLLNLGVKFGLIALFLCSMYLFGLVSVEERRFISGVYNGTIKPLLNGRRSSGAGTGR